MAADVTVIEHSRIEEINREHELCEASYRTAIAHALRCGELLAAAKAELRHGDWLPWLANNFKGDERTARAYMQLHRELSNRQRAADLQLPSSIRAGLKEIAKPRPRAQPKDAYGTIASDFVDDDEPAAGGPVSAAALEHAHERLKAENPLWTETHERRRRQILELLKASTAKLEQASKPGLAPVAVAELLRSSEIDCRQAQAKIGDLAFQFE